MGSHSRHANTECKCCKSCRAILAQGLRRLFGFQTTLWAPTWAVGPGKAIVWCARLFTDLQVGLAAAVDGAVPMRFQETLVLLQDQSPDKILAECKSRVLPAPRSRPYRCAQHKNPGHDLISVVVRFSCLPFLQSCCRATAWFRTICKAGIRETLLHRAWTPRSHHSRLLSCSHRRAPGRRRSIQCPSPLARCWLSPGSGGLAGPSC